MKVETTKQFHLIVSRRELQMIQRALLKDSTGGDENNDLHGEIRNFMDDESVPTLGINERAYDNT
jgi:hypothetical protein